MHGEWSFGASKALLNPKRSSPFSVAPKPKIGRDPHPADLHVGRQIAAVRVLSDVSQAQLARSIGVSVQQLQKYENARNRVSASMITRLASRWASPPVAFSKVFRRMARPTVRLPLCHPMSALASLPAQKVSG
ncbi:helix-turn-helix transcriptional regulator [Mesorhizobium sp. B3-2-1]|nr:helix-turn-helix transcriptional regulator [Mesorhizobium sp. B3-2-1]